ncbi:MAG: hypothetical protein Q7U03_06455 [Syntrophales bacterium]|nr:hypothetical protein [Syntrophales bacterium]
MKGAKRSEPRPSPRGIKVMFDGYVKSPEAAGMHPVWPRHRLLQRNWPQAKTAPPVIDSLERLLDIERLVPGEEK